LRSVPYTFDMDSIYLRCRHSIYYTIVKYADMSMDPTHKLDKPTAILNDLSGEEHR
jgi:hypothetical protein